MLASLIPDLLSQRCVAAQICALLAHLLFLRANGGTQHATALSDTFGTESFIAAALVTQVPDEFLQDIQQLYPNDRQIESGGMLALALALTLGLALALFCFSCRTQLLL